MHLATISPRSTRPHSRGLEYNHGDASAREFKGGPEARIACANDTDLGAMGTLKLGKAREGVGGRGVPRPRRLPQIMRAHDQTFSSRNSRSHGLIVRIKASYSAILTRE